MKVIEDHLENCKFVGGKQGIVARVRDIPGVGYQIFDASLSNFPLETIVYWIPSAAEGYRPVSLEEVVQLWEAGLIPDEEVEMSMNERGFPLSEQR